MTRRLAWALLLTGCASSAAPGAGPVVILIGADAGAPPEVTTDAGAAGGVDGGDARENRRIARMMKKVAAKRDLKALRPVPGAVLSRAELLARVKKHVEREVPPEAIKHQGLELQLLGFVPASFDYLGETFRLLEAQLAGFYEPEDGTMYLAADLEEDAADATLAHELDHALQDQHFDLKPHSKYTPGNSDEQLSYDALAEGDATSTMIEVLAGNALAAPDDLIAQQMLDGVNTGDSASAPHAMRTSLVAPYVYGTLFVNALRRSGGWDAVDAAWTTLPTTTEQVLHVEKWRTHEPALSVAAPTFAALGSGWTSVDEDTSGELGLRIAFEEWIGADGAKLAAAGWGGDRDVLLENGALSALAVHVRYDEKRDARGKGDDPFTLLAAGLPASVGKPAAKDATWLCIERPQLGPLAVMKRGRELVLVVGPAKNGGAAWSSAGSCGLAKKWASEIVVEK